MIDIVHTMSYLPPTLIFLDLMLNQLMMSLDDDGDGNLMQLGVSRHPFYYGLLLICDWVHPRLLNFFGMRGRQMILHLLYLVLHHGSINKIQNWMILGIRSMFNIMRFTIIIRFYQREKHAFHLHYIFKWLKKFLWMS